MSFFNISWDKKHNKIESHDKKQGRFPQNFKKHAHPILKLMELFKRILYASLFAPQPRIIV